MGEGPMDEARISLSHVSQMFSVLDQWSGARRHVFHEAGLSPSSLSDHDALPANDFLKLYSATVRLLEERTRSTPSTFRHTQDMSDLLGYAVVGSATLEDAVGRVGVFNRSIVTGAHVELKVRGRRARLYFDTHRREADEASRLVDGSVGMIYHKLFGWLLGRPIRLYEREEGSGAHEPGSPGAVIEFDREWLRAPVIATQRDLANCRGLFPFTLCFEPTLGRSNKAIVSAIMAQAVAQGAPVPAFVRIADRLNMGEQSLRRRLAAEGTSFQQLRDIVLRQRAEILLKSGISVVRVTEQLGFSDERAFRRAFRRWTRLSPSSFRDAEVGIARDPRE
ncbi:helix-turn-helix domain-containing protein [Sphingomonas sp. DBB INV C78]|uniref:helix-turn-helix domain-containing protein n=1 Tax=Sphingomonas sp. DBB INV C78 TaxID=3349434 RepID=UPI0036D3539D